MEALEEPPADLGLMCSNIHRLLCEPSPASKSHQIAHGPQRELHPALLEVIAPVVTPGDGSCLFHAISIAVCGMTALTQGLCTLSALLLAKTAGHQKCGAESKAMAAGEGDVI